MLKLLSLYELAAKLLSVKELMPGGAVDGKKTYLTAVAFVLYGLCGYYCGYLTPDEAVGKVLEGLGFGALRHAIGKAKSGGDPPTPPSAAVAVATKPINPDPPDLQVSRLKTPLDDVKAVLFQAYGDHVDRRVRLPIQDARLAA